MFRARPGCRWCARRTRTRRSMRIDTAAAQAMPGVLGVFTAADLRDLAPLPCTVPVASVAPMIVPPRPRWPRTACGTSAIRSRSSWPRRASPRATRRRRWAWTTACCRRWSMRRQHCCATRRSFGIRRPAICRTASRRATPDAVQAAMRAAAHVVELELVNNRIVISATGTAGRDRTARCRWLPPEVLRRRRARAAIAACRQRVPRAAGSRCGCPARMSAAGSA